MSRTFLRQDTQIRNSDVYDDTQAPASTMETTPVNIEDDLNNLRSLFKQAWHADAAGDWFSGPNTVNGKTRALHLLNTDLDDIEEKRLLKRTQVLTDIAVPATQNFVILSVAGSAAPSEVAAVSSSAQGAVVAVLGVGIIGSHSLAEVVGPNALRPFNLVQVVDATTLQPIQSNERDVFGLLQAENGVVDGEAFNDTNKRVQIAFVRVNSAGDDLEAVPAADIAGKTINYSYIRRFRLDDIPQDAFLSDGAFVDQVAAVDVTLDNAIDNQGGPATQAQNIQWRIDDENTLDWQTSDGARNLWRIAPSAAGDRLEANADDLDVNTTNPPDFDRGIKAATAGTEIDVGVNAGVIETAGVNNLRLLGAGELLLDDGNQTGSAWVQTTGIKLSDTVQEWDNFKGIFGEVSVLSGIVQAQQKSSRTRYVGNVTTNIAANTAIDGSPGTPNISAQLGDYSTVDFVSQVEIFINGELMRNGADALSDFDLYPAPTTTDQEKGIFFAKFPMKAAPGSPDIIQEFING